MPWVQQRWPASSYSASSRNCHNFTELFAKDLGVESPPRFGLFGSGDPLAPARGDTELDARSFRLHASALLTTGEGRASEGSLGVPLRRDWTMPFGPL
eukprot:g30159.t1